MTGPISDEGVLRKLLQHLNAQAPFKRATLSELEAMSEPLYIGRDGKEYAISREELRTIRGALDLLGIRDIRIPIVVMADSSFEQSSWRIEGAAECALVLRLLGRINQDSSDRVFLYAPHVATLRRLLPTTTVVLLMP